MFQPKVLSSSIIILTTLLITACNFETLTEESSQNSDAENTKEYPLVNSELWIHFENFEKEALRRNISLDLVELQVTGSITDIPEDGVAGTCRYGLHIHQVTIDQAYWNAVGSLRREMVVFHELGHCVLGLRHREADNNDGICLSLMNSGTTDCRVAYTSENREYYLNELFLEAN